jgi:hypothetical protein
MENKRLADIWLLVVTLNCARYAITELNDNMNKESKYKYKNLKTSIENFLVGMQTFVPKDDKERLSLLTFDNVGAMAETMTLIAHLPPHKYEEFLKGANELFLNLINEGK